MTDVDPIAALAHDLLRDRTGDLIAAASVWSVGMSDRPHYVRRSGRVKPSGDTLGNRAAAELPLSGEEDALISLGEARPGSFRDALNALTPNGTVYAESFQAELLQPFAVHVCVTALERVRAKHPDVWVDVLDDVGEDDDADLVTIVHLGEWAVPLAADAEDLLIAAIGDAPLLDVEAEGLANEGPAFARASTARRVGAAAPGAADPEPDDLGELAGALYLAAAAVHTAQLPVPVPPAEARRLLAVLTDEGLEPEEIARVLPALPVEEETVAAVRQVLDVSDR